MKRVSLISLKYYVEDYNMNIQELYHNEVINKIVDSILEDGDFKKKCEVNFKEILSDGKVDKEDIPLIINLILTVYMNRSKINVKKSKMKPVFMLLISKLIEEFKGQSSLDKNLILLLIEPQIDLLLMSVSLNCKWPWCCCRPKDEEENVINRIKVNKMKIKDQSAEESLRP